MNSQPNDNENGSIYEKFKKNTQKIFNEDSFKEGLDKGYQMLHNRELSKKGMRRNENKVRLMLYTFYFRFSHTSWQLY